MGTLLSFSSTHFASSETNLKIRQALPETCDLTSPQALARFGGTIAQNCTKQSSILHVLGTIECEGPNRHLYSFSGTLEYASALYPLSVRQVLLRVCMARHPFDANSQ
jgi:phospholipid-transporting ATPase